MGFEFRPAKLEGVGLFIAIAGSSRTGKTYTALRLARGIAGKTGKIAAIDTEGKRMSHYSDQFDFDVFNMKSPFNGNRFVEAAKGAEEQGYAVMVIDSFSLEWSGVGGVLAERERQWKETGYSGKMSDAIWNRVKGPGSEHRCMMNEFMQMTMPIIFCLRANEVADHLGGGWKVEQDKRFLYEWTIGLTLHPGTPGEPRFDLKDAKKNPLWKVPEIHRHLFPEGKFITEEAGAALQAWRNSSGARDMGSAAVKVEKRQTFAEWLAEIEEALAECATADAVEAIADRYDVKQALASGKETVVVRLNALIAAALRRVEDDAVPGFARGAVTTDVTGEAA